MFEKLRMKARENRLWRYRKELAFLNAEIERLERLFAATRFCTIRQDRQYSNWIGQRARLQVLLERELTKSGEILTAYTEKPVGLKEGVALKVKKEE